MGQAPVKKPRFQGNGENAAKFVAIVEKRATEPPCRRLPEAPKGEAGTGRRRGLAELQHLVGAAVQAGDVVVHEVVVHQAKALERQVLVHVRDGARQRRHATRQAAGGHDGGFVAELLEDAVDQAVHTIGLAVDDARLHGLGGVATDGGVRVRPVRWRPAWWRG